MQESPLNFGIDCLGECNIISPVRGGRFIGTGDRLLYDSDLKTIEGQLDAGLVPPTLEKAGPRDKIYFDPVNLRCGIVTCGGLCPGLNDVIRAIVLSLYHHYGVRVVMGFPFGFEGLTKEHGHTPRELTPEVVRDIHETGGTILGTSRGNQDVCEMVDTLERMNIGILFTIGGDGALHGAQAITEEIRKRGRKIAVIGIPKTIDNDISYVQKAFGFETAVSVAKTIICSAHTEATGARNGIGLVKLMGRESGFIAAYAVLADSNANFCLIPEVPFSLDTVLSLIKERLKKRGHAVIVVAEGVGQDLIRQTGERDASGNVRLGDIGLLLREKIHAYLSECRVEANIRYFDPSYTIRSVPTNAHDSAFCLLLGHCAVHAGMAGRTNMVVSSWRNEFVHIPIPLAVSKRQKIDPDGSLWSSVLAATGQPRDLLSQPLA